MLSLGEFENLVPLFSEHPQTGFCYILFVGATFVSQVTMLNMVIAIMGDSFERITENKLLNSVKTKIQLCSELTGNVETLDEEDDDFIFVATLDDNEEDGG